MNLENFGTKIQKPDVSLARYFHRIEEDHLHFNIPDKKVQTIFITVQNSNNLFLQHFWGFWAQLTSHGFFFFFRKNRDTSFSPFLVA